ncbi:hypothetical protein [Psychromonas aquimarina]|uniref:hypothetical protein n=1 Tax=Psychromonas aquimarina TaxID=444919 RepID=UPI00048FAA59|nr:hypothetical protein [Psychromonas aquimarina]
MKNITMLFTVYFLFTINNTHAYPGESLQTLCEDRNLHESKHIKSINVSTEKDAYAMNILIDNSWYFLDLREGKRKVIPRSEMFNIARYAFEEKLFVNVCTGSNYVTGIEIVAP